MRFSHRPAATSLKLWMQEFLVSEHLNQSGGKVFFSFFFFFCVTSVSTSCPALNQQPLLTSLHQEKRRKRNWQ